jgi:hypothetical protein
MQIKKSLSVAVTLALFAGVAVAADQAAYDKAVADAKAALAVAGKAGGEWRDSGEMLKKADELAKAGDFAGAIKLADEAAFQGRMGAQQANEQANAGNPSYLY